MNARVIPYLLIAPSLAFLTVLFFVPLVETVALAFQADGAWSAVNFARMAGDLNFTDAVVNTFEIVVIVVPLQLLLWLVAGAIAQTILHYSCCPGATSTSLSWWSSRCNPPWREAGCPPTAVIFAGAKRDLSPSSAFFSSWFGSRHPHSNDQW
jgi:hypothetical protein